MLCWAIECCECRRNMPTKHFEICEVLIYNIFRILICHHYFRHAIVWCICSSNSSRFAYDWNGLQMARLAIFGWDSNAICRGRIVYCFCYGCWLSPAPPPPAARHRHHHPNCRQHFMTPTCNLHSHLLSSFTSIFITLFVHLVLRNHYPTCAAFGSGMISDKIKCVPSVTSKWLVR